jgi:outer membrane receptor for ferrienterochelin and colicin
VGFDYKPRTWFYLSGSGFRTKTEDLIAWAPDTAGYWYPANIDRSNILGSELKLKLQPYELVSLDLEATILDAGQTKEEIVYSDFITGETRTELKTRPAAFIPRQTISGDLRIRPIPGSVISLRCRYTAERSNYYPDYSEAPTVKMVPKELPSQFVVGLDLSQQILKKVDLHFGIDNLFDARLGDQFGNSLEDRDYPLPGRQFALELKVQP